MNQLQTERNMPEELRNADQVVVQYFDEDGRPCAFAAGPPAYESQLLDIVEVNLASYLLRNQNLKRGDFTLRWERV